jgi:hypothetical protein
MNSSLPLIVAVAAVGVLLSSEGLVAGSPSCDRQLVMQIDSAYITVERDGVTINAFGVAESAGWSAPTLVKAGEIANGAATVDFVACRPEVSAQVQTPIQTKTKLPIGPEVRAIVIHTKTNSMTVEITRR